MRLYLFLFGALFFFLSSPLFAQQALLIPVESWQNVYIKRLQQQGHLLSLNPSVSPYKQQEVLSAISKADQASLSAVEKKWISQLKHSLISKENDQESEITTGGQFLVGTRKSSSARLDVLSPIGESEIALPRAQPHGYMEWKSFITRAGITFDLFYELDPDGLDVARRLMIRSEDTYLGFYGDLVDLYVGRYSNHWSLYDQEGGFLTDNARSFDHLNFKFGNSKISFRSILGELDGLNPNGQFRGYRFGTGSIKRYAFLHRLDWRPTPNWMISFIEGELYYSESAGIQLRNLMPLHIMFFESENAPVNTGSNLFVGGSIWYHKNKLTLFGQFMLDDFDLDNAGTLTENETLSPPTYTINSSLYIANFIGHSGIGVTADFVSTNSYSGAYLQDQWTYAGRGLATFTSDYIKANLFTDLYFTGKYDLHIKPYVTAYFKGIKDFHTTRIGYRPEEGKVSSILLGTIERTIRPGINIRFQPLKKNSNQTRTYFTWWLDLDVGMNFIKNHNHIMDNSEQEFSALFRIFGRVSF